MQATGKNCYKAEVPITRTTLLTLHLEVTDCGLRVGTDFQSINATDDSVYQYNSLLVLLSIPHWKVLTQRPSISTLPYVRGQQPFLSCSADKK